VVNKDFHKHGLPAVVCKFLVVWQIYVGGIHKLKASHHPVYDTASVSRVETPVDTTRRTTLHVLVILLSPRLNVGLRMELCRLCSKTDTAIIHVHNTMQ